VITSKLLDRTETKMGCRYLGLTSTGGRRDWGVLPQGVRLCSLTLNRSGTDSFARPRDGEGRIAPALTQLLRGTTASPRVAL
jgi:hypothetical protein